MKDKLISVLVSEAVLEKVDIARAEIGLSRSAFVRVALAEKVKDIADEKTAEDEFDEYLLQFMSPEKQKIHRKEN
ncbi:MAG: ribbon-helix-helix protein, CopG family [Candidatus Saccharimonadales bacterium]